MRAQEEGTALDLLLPGLRFGLRQPGLLEDPRDPTRQVSCRLTHFGRQWPISNHRPDTRHDERYGRDEIGAQFAEACGHDGVFELSTWTGIRRFGDDALGIVRPRNHRHPFTRNTGRPQRTRRLRGLRTFTKQSEHNSMGHRQDSRNRSGYRGLVYSVHGAVTGRVLPQ